MTPPTYMTALGLLCGAQVRFTRTDTGEILDTAPSFRRVPTLISEFGNRQIWLVRRYGKSVSDTYLLMEISGGGDDDDVYVATVCSVARRTTVRGRRLARAWSRFIRMRWDRANDGEVRELLDREKYYQISGAWYISDGAESLAWRVVRDDTCIRAVTSGFQVALGNLSRQQMDKLIERLPECCSLVKLASCVATAQKEECGR